MTFLGRDWYQNDQRVISFQIMYSMTTFYIQLWSFLRPFRIIQDQILHTEAAIYISNPLIYRHHLDKPKYYYEIINFTEPQLALQIVLFCAFSGATYLGVKSPPRVRIGHSPS